MPVLMFGFGWWIYRVIVSRVVDRDMFTSLLAMAIFPAAAHRPGQGRGVRIRHAFPLRGFGNGRRYQTDLGVILIVVVFMRIQPHGPPSGPRPRTASAGDGHRYRPRLCLHLRPQRGDLRRRRRAISMIWVIQPFRLAHSIRAFVIVTAAGLGLPGVIAAGLGLGATEQFGGFVFGAEYQPGCSSVIRQLQQRRHRQAVI